MALRAALFWSATQTGVRMLVGFLSIKVTAVYLGPAGLALVGQAGNFLTLLHGHVSSAVATAATRMAIQGRDSGRDEAHVWGTALRLVALIGIALGLLVALLEWPVAQWLFGDTEHAVVLVVIGAVLPLVMLQQVGLGMLSARMDFRGQAATQIGASVLGAAVFVPLSYWYGLPGGLIGAVLSYAAGFVVLLGVLRWRAPLRLRHVGRSWQGPLVRPLLALYPMLVANSVAAPLTQLLVRNALIDSVGSDQAGLWQATLRISDMYTLVLQSALSMYTVPALSAMTGSAQDREAMSLSLKAGAMTALLALLLYLGRDLIVHLLLTARFAPVSSLLGAQLLGDVLKMAGWPLRAALTVQQRARSYITIEVGMMVAQIGLTYVLLPRWGVHAGPYAYVLAGGMIFVGLLWLHRAAFRAGRE